MCSVYGNDAHIAPLLSGFVSNPMEQTLKCFEDKKDFYVNLNKVPVKAVRFGNKKAEEQQTYLRPFTVITDNK